MYRYNWPRVARSRGDGRNAFKTAGLIRTAAALAGATAFAFATSLSSSPAALASARASTLPAGQQLQAGQELVSTGGQYALAMQTDGNLVIYGNGCVLWASGTAGSGSNDDLSMQGDGNLVIYTAAGKAVWASGTTGSGTANYLNMQADGNLVVYTSTAKPVWASGVSNADQLCAPDSMALDQYLQSPNGQYKLLMQDDGNLVIYGNGKATWASNTVGAGGSSLNMQGDGNLVIYTSGGKAVWSTGTSGTGNGNRLVMQNDGNLVVYSSIGRAVWASNTAGGSQLTMGTWGGTAGPGAASKYYGYPYSNPPACTDGGACNADKWDFFQGQCTSWVAYRLNQLNGIAFGDYFGGDGKWGPAADWGSHARALGIAVNGTPAVGSVAWYSYGHVAYVEQVNSPTSIVISEMNIDNDNGFAVHAITTSSGHWPTDFIHVADR